MGILLPLIAAVGGWYVASRLATLAVSRGRESPVRRAAAQCIPLLALVLVAVFRHQPEIAIGVVFGTCVATLSLALGVVTFTAPPRHHDRTGWAAEMGAGSAGGHSHFSCRVSISIHVDGCGGPFHRRNCVAFGLGATFQSCPRGLDSSQRKHERPRSSSAGPWLIVFAIIISVGAGWLGVTGSQRLLLRSGLPSMSIIAALLLGPAMVLPMIGTATTLSQRGLYAQVIDSFVAYVLLSLCAVLPILILTWHLNRPAPNPAPTSEPTTQVSLDDEPAVPLVFPILVWRVDCVMLLILGISLLPFSTSRWLPGRPEGLFLILLYVAYMILWRWGAMLS